MNPTCATCLHWEPFEDDSEAGLCRRHAPRPIDSEKDATDTSGIYYPCWPLTFATDHCGDHQPAPRETTP